MVAKTQKSFWFTDDNVNYISEFRNKFDFKSEAKVANFIVYTFRRYFDDDNIIAEELKSYDFEDFRTSKYKKKGK